MRKFKFPIKLLLNVTYCGAFFLTNIAFSNLVAWQNVKLQFPVLLVKDYGIYCPAHLEDINLEKSVLVTECTCFDYS